jgi:hypothetical protein
MVGHTDWAVATYEGNIFWQNHKGTDCDSDLLLYTAKHGGLTDGNCDTTLKGGFGVEFDSREITDSIATADEKFFWQVYANEVRGSLCIPLQEEVQGIKAAPAAQGGSVLDRLNGKYAIVTGVLGMDFEHGGHSELHPVYAVAVHLKDGEVTSDGTVEDVWIMFVRNWGNEGFCSSRRKENALFDKDRFTFELPGRLAQGFSGSSSAGKLPFELGDCSKDKANCSRYLAVNGEPAKPSIVYDQGNTNSKPRVFVTFTLPEPSTKAFAVAELHLRWQGVPKEHLDPAPAGPDSRCSDRRSLLPAQESAEERLERLFRQLPQQQILELQKKTAESSQKKGELLQADTIPFPKATDQPLPIKADKEPLITPSAQADQQDVAVDDLLGTTICDQYQSAKKNDPKLAVAMQAAGLDKVCKKRPKP